VEYMESTLLIIISGPPCTGKTTLANKVARKFNLPLMTKDDIKESLFDSLGTRDREWSKLLGISSYRLLYYFMESILKAGHSLIVESNFRDQHDSERLRNLTKKYGFVPFQIQCKTNGDVLFERYKKRSESGKRHPGHVDHLNYAEFKEELLKGSYKPLDLEGEVIYIDTTDYTRIDYNRLFKRIQDFL
jgi:predicted kinase